MPVGGGGGNYGSMMGTLGVMGGGLGRRRRSVWQEEEEQDVERMRIPHGREGVARDRDPPSSSSGKATPTIIRGH